MTSRRLARVARCSCCSCSDSCRWPAALHAPGAGGADVAATDVPKIAFEKYTLPNGLDVILSEDHRLPLVAVNLWYHVGPANEEPGRTGFAHLFEHMMFQGSKHVPGDTHFKSRRRRRRQRHQRHHRLRSHQLLRDAARRTSSSSALWLESDRMGYLLDMVDQAKLSNQQDVVRNERRQSVENQPYGIVEEAMFHQLLSRRRIRTTRTSSDRTPTSRRRKLDDVKNFFKQYYAPNNASLAIVGDIDKAADQALVEKYFGPLQAGPAGAEAVRRRRRRSPRERRAVVKDRVELPRVYMAWITLADLQAGRRRRRHRGQRARRRQVEPPVQEARLREADRAGRVSAQQYSLMLGSVFIIEATARPGHTAEEIETAVDAELARVPRDGPEQAEVERARNAIETRISPGPRDVWADSAASPIA